MGNYIWCCLSGTDTAYCSTAQRPAVKKITIPDETCHLIVFGGNDFGNGRGSVAAAASHPMALPSLGSWGIQLGTHEGGRLGRRGVSEMSLVSRILIGLTARKIGEDEFGNSYYEARRAKRRGRIKRFVVYSGTSEASKVPADWHGWLHHTESDPPPTGGYARRPWQKAHQPNLTGTVHAYKPAGHLTRGGKRRSASGDYEAWKPE